MWSAQLIYNGQTSAIRSGVLSDFGDSTINEMLASSPIGRNRDEFVLKVNREALQVLRMNRAAMYHGINTDAASVMPESACGIAIEVEV